MRHEQESNKWSTLCSCIEINRKDSPDHLWKGRDLQMKNSSVDKVLLGYYDMISLFDMMSLFGKRTTEHKKISLSRKECHGCCYLPQINQRTLLIIPEESHILNGMLISLLFFSSKCNFYIFFFAHYWL